MDLKQFSVLPKMIVFDLGSYLTPEKFDQPLI